MAKIIWGSDMPMLSWKAKRANKIINIGLFLLLLVVIGSIIYSPAGRCDGIDHDSSFYGKDVIVQPDEITVWKQYNGIWVRELPRYQLPNGHFMLDKNNVNYWRDFDRYPCHYPIWHGYECFELDDDIRYVNVRKEVPEPKVIGLLGVGLLFMGIRSKIRGKL